MIQLDTNILIALPQWARDGHPLIDRIIGGEPVGVSSIAWYEFVIGPLADGEAALARAFVRDNIVAIEAADATLAAELFNACGRKRTLKTDALIAATAIRTNAEFATVNRDDFIPFVDHGLRLLEA